MSREPAADGARRVVRRQALRLACLSAVLLAIRPSGHASVGGAAEPARKPSADAAWGLTEDPSVPSASNRMRRWARATSLRDTSDDGLNWIPPQPDPSLAGNPHPSFLDVIGNAPQNASQPLRSAAVSLNKAAQSPPPDAEASDVGRSLSVPTQLPSHVVHRAAPLSRATDRGHRNLQLTGAQQPPALEEEPGVFDDVLDELLPSDGPGNAPSGAAPDELLDDPLPEDLEEALGPLPDDPDATLPGDPSDPAADLLEDVFGDEPARPQPDAADDLPADLPALPSEPPSLQPPQELDEQDSIVPERARPLPGRSTPAAPRLPDDSIVDFNGRDCPAELADLQEAWERLRRTPISSITLDITPAVDPSDLLNQAIEPPQEAIRRSPSRSWRDRQGRPVIEGKMEDFRNNKILVRASDGETRWLSWYDLSNEDLCFVSAWWNIPSEFNPAVEPYQIRNWTMTTFTWTASALCHKPLYFEEVQLERYGHTAGPVKQTFLSGAHFFGNIFFLPYHIGLNPPTECQYALGYYRPGDCAPWMVPAVPLSSRAFRMQMGALVSGLTLLP